MNEIQALLSGNLKKLRKEHGLSQAKLAEQIHTAANYISQIEQGHKFPSPAMLEKLANAFEVNSYQLFIPQNVENIEEIEEKIYQDLKKTIGLYLKEYALLFDKKTIKKE
ncbi:MAG TPA: helix-turn-helix transcriptional regulator [Treponemataceae bacterium]|nr:helix-turn-helix transcriptional regulator [Treponemataceae bacterium]